MNNTPFTGYLLLSRGLNRYNKPTSYRGVYRKEPTYPNEESAELDLWFETAKATHESNNFIEKKEDALRFQQAYREFGQEYELLECIEVTQEDYPCSGELIGYDVADFNGHSIILWYSYDEYDGRFILENRMIVMHTLMLRYFSSLLNKDKLLNNWEDAKLLRETELFLAKHIPERNNLHITEDWVRVFKLSVVGG